LGETRSTSRLPDECSAVHNPDDTLCASL
jgi:hypothetical protein